jgi:small subunit ribosomal protein S17
MPAVKKITKRQFKGVVVSDKMNKTVVVRVDATKIHPRYQKRFKTSKRLKAHDEKNEFKVGDRVVMQECRPLSKNKKWRVLNKI